MPLALLSQVPLVTVTVPRVPAWAPREPPRTAIKPPLTVSVPRPAPLLVPPRVRKPLMSAVPDVPTLSRPTEVVPLPTFVLFALKEPLVIETVPLPTSPILRSASVPTLPPVTVIRPLLDPERPR